MIEMMSNPKSETTVTERSMDGRDRSNRRGIHLALLEFSLAAMVLLGCGGEKTQSSDMARARSEVDSASAGGGGPTGALGGTGPTEMTCTELSDRISVLRTEALACCPTCPSQCEHVVQDACCEITVQQPSDELADYVEEYRARCASECTEPPGCRSTVTGVCDPSTNRCRQN